MADGRCCRPEWCGDRRGRRTGDGGRAAAFFDRFAAPLGRAATHEPRHLLMASTAHLVFLS
ncbi:MAG: hypothetical protein EHM55_07010 [Acidobacteria bacterium]|nr:MAG: hypothetical protein EHM55_07010 [Acidobacteriota bacterium]